MLAWLRANRKVEQRPYVPPEEFFKGCATKEEKHARVAAAYPDDYMQKPKAKAKRRT
jgi:hypothetical protein